MSISELVPFLFWVGAVVVLVIMYRGKKATTTSPPPFAEVDPSTLEAVEFFWRPG